MNTKCGKETQFLTIIGSGSVHDISNNNDLRVISLTATKDMVISSTTFPHKKIHKVTGKSANGKTTPNRPCVDTKTFQILHHGCKVLGAPTVILITFW